MKTDKTMTCRRFREQLDELLAGTLSDAERRSMEEHAAACEACAAALRDARRALDAATPHIEITPPAGPADDWPSREANPDRPHPPSPNLPWQPTFQQQSRTQPRAPRPAA